MDASPIKFFESSPADFRSNESLVLQTLQCKAHKVCNLQLVKVAKQAIQFDQDPVRVLDDAMLFSDNFHGQRSNSSHASAASLPQSPASLRLAG